MILKSSFNWRNSSQCLDVSSWGQVIPQNDWSWKKFTYCTDKQTLHAMEQHSFLVLKFNSVCGSHHFAAEKKLLNNLKTSFSRIVVGKKVANQNWKSKLLPALVLVRIQTDKVKGIVKKKKKKQKEKKKAEYRKKERTAAGQLCRAPVTYHHIKASTHIHHHLGVGYPSIFQVK